MPPNHPHPFHPDARCLRMLMWAIVLVAFGQAFWHMLAVCRPLISSDNWTFVDPFLFDATAGTLDIGNFLVKRAGVDHAQPLNKLVMWGLYRFYDLDFVGEGVIAMGFGLVAIGVLFLGVVARSERAAPATVSVPLAFAAIACVFFSVNTSMIYSYSMVTMWFSLYCLVFLQTLLGWRALQGRSWWPLAAVTFVYGIVGDDSALMLGVAMALALGLHAWRSGEVRPAVVVLGVVAVGLLCARVVYGTWGATVGTTQEAFNQPIAARLGALADGWRDAWRWLVVPSASGLAAPEVLQGWFGSGWQVVQVMLGLGVMAAHVQFWICAVRIRIGRAWFTAIVLMLLFYAHVAGLLLGRIFARGAEFLDQQRYVSFYQLGIIALLAMAIAWRVQSARAPRRAAWMAGIAALVIALQVPLGIEARKREAGLQAVNLHLAHMTAAVARAPLHPPPGCSIRLCRLPPDQRVRIMQLLQAQRTSLFSPAFQRRHPEIAAAVAAAGP